MPFSADPLTNAKASYEKYVTLARAAARSGDVVETENYYQHAEHYFRQMKGERIGSGHEEVDETSWVSKAMKRAE